MAKRKTPKGEMEDTEQENRSGREILWENPILGYSTVSDS